MNTKIAEDFRELVCIPRKHTHPPTPRALMECALAYMAEDPDELTATS